MKGHNIFLLRNTNKSALLYRVIYKEWCKTKQLVFIWTWNERCGSLRRFVKLTKHSRESVDKHLHYHRGMDIEIIWCGGGVYRGIDLFIFKCSQCVFKLFENLNECFWWKSVFQIICFYTVLRMIDNHWKQTIGVYLFYCNWIIIFFV